MADRAIVRIARRLLEFTAYAVVLGIVVFFAFTRTDVGRSEVRQQLEDRFNATFTGTLEIGHLEGNLITDLHARNVRILDPDGRPFLSVDSVIARPRWNALVSRQVSFRSVTLLEPTVHVRHRADSTWNVDRVFQRTNPSQQDPPSFTLANLRLQRGTIRSENDGAAPPLVHDGWAFDYTNAVVRDVSAHLTIEWSDEEQLVDVFRLSGQLSDPAVQLTELQGQFLKDDARWTFNQARLGLDSTRIQFDAAVDQLDADSLSAARLDLDLSRSTIHFDELQSLIPRLPLASTVTAEASIQGPISDLTIDVLDVEHGASRLRGAGTVRGLPDSLSIDAEWSESTLAARDLSAVWPTADTSAWAHLSPVNLSGSVSGALPLDHLLHEAPLQFESEFAVNAAAGRISGRAEIRRDRVRSPLQFTGEIQTDSVNAGAIMQSDAFQSQLSGQITFDGRGTSRDSLQGTLNASFAASTFNGHPLDALRLTAAGQQGEFTGRLRMAPAQRGALELSGALNLNAPTPTFRLLASTQNFDLATLPLDYAPSTRLNVDIEAQGRGLQLHTVAGAASVVFDSSTVRHGSTDRRIPPNRSTITLTPQASQQTAFQVEGDLAWLRVEGDVRLRPLWSLGNLWGRALADAARRAWNKPYDGSPAIAARTPVVLPDEEPPFPSDAMTQWRTVARSDLARAGLHAGMGLDVQLNLHRTDILNALFPGLASVWTDARSRVSLRASADELSVQGQVAADSLDAPQLQTEGFDSSFRLNGHLDAPLTETITGEIELQSQQATAGPLPLTEPALTFRYENRTGHLEFESAEGSRSGPFRLGIRLDLLADRNEITLHDALVVAGAYRWTNAQPASLYAYSGALVIPGFTLESPLTADSPPQRIQVQGTLSAEPRDTVRVATEEVLLYPLSQLVEMNRPIGGILNGTMALSGGLQRPAITTEMNISWLSFGQRLLGHLDATSRYDDASAAINLDAALASADSALSDRPAYLPATLHQTERNRLRVRGDIQLPSTPARGPGALLAESTVDLNADVERADLFFFEYIFDEHIENVSGFFAGTAQVRGTFFDPLFQADLQVIDGQFDLPRFNLTYQIAGPVRVDRAGISLDDVQVTGPESGTATLQGTVLFNEYRYFSFDLAGDLDEMQIINVDRSQDLPFYGSIWASGRATLTGPLSDATLRAPDAQTTPDSELYIPVSEEDVENDSGFIIFADSTGQFPDLDQVTQRDNVLADRPAGEPSFLDGIELDLNVTAPEGATVHLVFDPLLGDVVTAQGTGRVQIQREEGDFFTYGSLEVTGGEYLFTAGEVFYRRFTIDQGTITWDGDPTNAQLDIDASYRTRASTAGLPGTIESQGRIPVIVQLGIAGRVESPRVDLSLGVDRQDRTAFVNETLDSFLNQPGLATEFATSVLLTNTFLLTTTPTTTARPDGNNRLTSAGNQLAFTSVSQLVASQLNRYLSAALPALDINLELQGEDPQNLDVIYGVALRLLDERLIIRGEGVYAGNDEQRRRTEGIEGEFVVEVRLSGNVSVEAFYRRSGNELLNDQTLTSTTGAGVSYRTEFSSWRSLLNRFLGWLIGSDDAKDESDDPSEPTPTSSAKDTR